MSTANVERINTETANVVNSASVSNSGSRVVSQMQWIAARKDLLRKEKEFTRLRDELSRERLELPWEKVEKEYLFDGPNGKQTLSNLFAGKSQLIVYHFMFGPDWPEGCPGCSFLADHFDGSLAHLAARDVQFVAVSRAPLSKIESFKKRMGWQFKWVSSNETDFNSDYHVSFSKDEIAKGQTYYNYVAGEFKGEEGPGASVFFKDGSGNIFHTYSSYGRGLESMIGAYNWLDIAPKGRDEASLMPQPMAWVRHHDKYVETQMVDPKSLLVARKA
jgi:predicted dithiol-disulfide oxidoreductase (DUF899 family)